MLRRTLESARSAGTEDGSGGGGGGMVPAGSEEPEGGGEPGGVYVTAMHVGGRTGVAWWCPESNVLCGCEGADSAGEGWCAGGSGKGGRGAGRSGRHAVSVAGAAGGAACA